MSEQIEKEIYLIAKDIFPFGLVRSFVSTFQNLLTDEMPIDFVLQISTDQGNELELGFFTSTRITDVTLSNGSVYFYSYPISSIHQIQIIDTDLKSTLTIQGEKKFDYNVVKPEPITCLEQYESSLKNYLARKTTQAHFEKENEKILG